MKDGLLEIVKRFHENKDEVDKIDYLVKSKIDFIEYVAISEENQYLKDSLADIKIKLVEN